VTEKLQKVLARLGIGSRRQIEIWIQQGRIQVNQHLAILGQRVTDVDVIRIDGKPLRQVSPPKRQILCYHKPLGQICTRHDPEQRPSIFEHLPPPKQGKWITVGRLDINTGGLLLLTTDGELAHRLMHPSYCLEREYAVRILGPVSPQVINNMLQGVFLEDGPAHFKSVIKAGGQGANAWYHVTISEGKKREVRRLWESQNITVSRLMRIRFGPFILPKGLKAGHYVYVSEEEERTLLAAVGLDTTAASTPKKPPFRPTKRQGY